MTVYFTSKNLTTGITPTGLKGFTEDLDVVLLGYTKSGENLKKMVKYNIGDHVAYNYDYTKGHCIITEIIRRGEYDELWGFWVNTSEDPYDKRLHLYRGVMYSNDPRVFLVKPSGPRCGITKLYQKYSHT